MSNTEYGFRTTVNIPYEQAIEKVTTALKTEGFGVLTTIDIEATLKKKLDVDFRPYTILGACNPALANQALDKELEIGLLLPCNVIVYDNEAGGSIIAIVDPAVILGVVDNQALDAIADEARTRLQRVIQSLKV